MIVEVTWLDAERGDDEPNPGRPIGATRKTVGHVVERTDEGIVIAMSHDTFADRMTYERYFAIPKLYIKRVRRLQ